MYLDFFKFRKNPFHITPDPDFLFLSPSHHEAFSSISLGIEQRNGLVVVTGEVGVGKTTILRSYLEGTDPARIRIVYIFNAALSFGKLMKQIVSELGIPAVDKDLPNLIDSLFLYLIDEYKNDRRVVLIIDEAQNLPVETLERFRMLSKRETSQEKLLQVILVGQSEFENKLNLPELRDLKQRIARSCRIDTLQPDESLAYIQHRLMKASSFHNPVFTKDALKRIVKESRGIPRIINVVCDNALITAFGYQRNAVDDKIIKEVIKDLRGEQPQTSFRWKFVWLPALFGFSGLVVFSSMALLTPKETPPIRTEIFSAKIPALPPAAGKVKELGCDPPVEEASRAKPEPSIPEVPATGSDKSASEIAPPAPAQLQISGNTQTSAAETVKELDGDPAAEEAASAEPEPSIPEVPAAGSDKSVSEIVPPAPVQSQISGNTQAAAAETVKELDGDPAAEEASRAEPGPSIPEVPATGSDKSASEIVPPAPVQWQIPGSTQAAAAETVKELGGDPPVEEASRAEPESSTPAVPATGSDKSVSEIVPPVQWQIPGNTQAAAAEKAPVSNDGGAPAQGDTAEGPKLQSCRYMVQLGSFADRETAEEIKARLEEYGYSAVVKTRKHQVPGKVFVIQLQPVASASRAARLMTQLRGEFEGEPMIIKVPSR